MKSPTDNNQNESPFGQPKTLVLFLVVFLFLFGWQYMVDKMYPKQTPTAQNNLATNTATTATQPAAQTTSPTTVSAKTETVVAAVQNKPTAAAPAEQTFQYEDEFVVFQVTSNGFGLSNYSLKTFKDREGKFISFVPKVALYSVLYKGQPVSFNISKISDFEFEGTAQVDLGTIKRKLSFDKVKHAFTSKIEFPKGIEQLTIAVDAEKLVPKNNSVFFPSFEHQDFVFVADGKTSSEAISTLREGEGLLVNTERVSMASIGSQYFTAAAINKSDILPSLNKRVEGNTAYLNIQYNLKDTSVTEINQIYFVGAKQTEVLGQIDPQLSEVMNYGMFGFISKPLLKLLKLMFDVFGNWGLALIAMTVIVRMILLPFNVMSFRSAQAMQKIKPEMDRVRELYKNDPMRMNKETMAIMKENNANPVSGCLPMLLQIPIFFALWKMISTSVELYQQPFFGWITDLSYHDTFFVLPILMGVTMYLQQKMTPSTLEPMQQKILNFMPIIFTVFMLSLPSGLTLYNLVSSLFGVVQQYFLLKDKRKEAAELKAAKT